MLSNQAMLGETPKLFKETEEWTKSEMKRNEKNEKARKQVMESIRPLLEKKKEKLILGQE